jgi:hypothetical protein
VAGRLCSQSPQLCFKTQPFAEAFRRVMAPCSALRYEAEFQCGA